MEEPQTAKPAVCATQPIDILYSSFVFIYILALFRRFLFSNPAPRQAVKSHHPHAPLSEEESTAIPPSLDKKRPGVVGFCIDPLFSYTFWLCSAGFYHFRFLLGKAGSHFVFSEALRGWRRDCFLCRRHRTAKKGNLPASPPGVTYHSSLSCLSRGQAVVHTPPPKKHGWRIRPDVLCRNVCAPNERIIPPWPTDSMHNNR